MGIYSPTDINRVIKGTTFYTDRKKYSFVKLNRKDYAKLLDLAKSFTDEYMEIIYDKDELTLITTEEIWTKLSSNLTPEKIDDPIAIITCEVKEPTVTGYLLAFLQKLSPANVSVFVQGAFTTDHIFVYHKDLEKTIKILEKIKSNLPQAE
jgi:hypothetical protein